MRTSWQVIVVLYISPTANPMSAYSTIHTSISKLRTKHPSALIIMSGDFNHFTTDTVLLTFKQYVSCPTREERTLDLMYANIKDAFISSSLPPLGRSDHNLVHLKPCYVSLVKRKPMTTRTVRRWSEEALEALQACFEVTDWPALSEPHWEDIDGLTECITDYINLCGLQCPCLDCCLLR